MVDEEEFLNMGEDASEAVLPSTGLGIDGNAPVPTMEEIFRLIESAAGLSDEEKASIKEDVIKYQAEQESMLNGGIVPAAATAGGLFAPNTLLFIILVSIIALIIAFFVYKLIKTEKDKIKSKELKRLAKEQRKSKKKKT